jgi:hypothetical protein
MIHFLKVFSLIEKISEQKKLYLVSLRDKFGKHSFLENLPKFRNIC